MPEWATNFFTDNLAQGSTAIWNFCMYITYKLLSWDFDFSESTGSMTFTEVYNWFLVFGVILLNIFALIGFIRQTARLRENVTLEMWIELFIKVILANAFMLYGLKIVGTLLDMSGAISAVWMSESEIDIVSEVDFGAVLAYVLFGIIWLIASIICGIYIVIAAAKRIVNIYILTVTMPIACSTLSGGGEIESSGWSWFKAFLAECFEIVFIVLAMLICGMLHNSINNAIYDATAETIIISWFDGFVIILLDIVYMVMLCVSVQGAGNLLKRTFNLK